MEKIKSQIQNLKSKIQNGLIVSCQAPANSPLAKREIITAFAETAVQNVEKGAKAAASALKVA